MTGHCCACAHKAGLSAGGHVCSVPAYCERHQAERKNPITWTIFTDQPSEDDRWWQVYAACWTSAMGHLNNGDAAEACANAADAAIEEARKRGRLGPNGGAR